MPDMIKRIKPTYAIGIDTGVETGLAIWDCRVGKFTRITTTGAYKAMRMILVEMAGVPVADIFLRIEDARLRTWVPWMATESRERGRREGAGSVKRDASFWEEFVEVHELPHEFVAPKSNKTKLKAPVFQKITGWPGKTSGHARDAAMLVFKY